MEDINLSELNLSKFSLYGMTPDELLAFAITRKKCYDLLMAKRAEFVSCPINTWIIVSESGNYTLGNDVFEANDKFEELYPDDRGKRRSFSVGDIQ
ncbi:MAG: hypothetical protein ABSE76_02135 [Minisyncoccia bacterium]